MFTRYLAVAIGAALLASASDAQAQHDGFRLASLAARGRPSTTRLFLGATAGAALGAGGLGAGGILVDQALCESRHRGEENHTLFGPCFFPAGTATAVGWHGGGVFGATRIAVRLARRRGCPPRQATWRALGGAVVGALPGLVATISRSDGRWRPARSAVVFSAPLITGAGAAAAVAGCGA